jgi:hypothetical protein
MKINIYEPKLIDMKRRLVSLAILLLFSTSITMAQFRVQQPPRTQFGILGGVNFQNLNGKDFAGDALENSMITGFHLGVTMQVPIVPEFYFEPGLLYTTKGAQGDYGPVEGTVRLNYLEVPLNFLYKGALGNGFVLLGFGPYLGYALSGNLNLDTDVAGFDTQIRFQNTVESDVSPLGLYLRRFDAGGNIYAGYQFGMGVFVRLNAQLGLLNIYPDDQRFSNNEARWANTGFGFSVGYLF